MKAELNDQLSDRQTCRQESSELTRANRKLFRYITKYQNCEKKKNKKNIHFDNKKNHTHGSEIAKTVISTDFFSKSSELKMGEDGLGLGLI